MSDMFRGIDGVRSALDYHLSRHNVLSSNIANAETPGFSPQELLREREHAGPNTLPLQSTVDTHIGSARAEQSPEKRDYEVRDDRTAQPGANGNSVSLEHEMAKLAANDIRFEGAVKIVSHQLGMLRYAANDGSGG